MLPGAPLRNSDGTLRRTPAKVLRMRSTNVLREKRLCTSHLLSTFTSQLGALTSGRSSLNRVCKQFSTPWSSKDSCSTNLFFCKLKNSIQNTEVLNTSLSNHFLKQRGFIKKPRRFRNAAHSEAPRCKICALRKNLETSFKISGLRVEGLVWLMILV